MICRHLLYTCFFLIYLLIQNHLTGIVGPWVGHTPRGIISGSLFWNLHQSTRHIGKPYQEFLHLENKKKRAISRRASGHFAGLTSSRIMLATTPQNYPSHSNWSLPPRKIKLQIFKILHFTCSSKEKNTHTQMAPESTSTKKTLLVKRGGFFGGGIYGRPSWHWVVILITFKWSKESGIIVMVPPFKWSNNPTSNG